MGEGNSEQCLTTKLRRILITQWDGEAYSKLNGPEYDNLRWICFERTGCLIIADSSDDDRINPECLESYVIPPPLPTPLSDERMAVEAPTPGGPPHYILLDVDNEEDIPEVGDDDLKVDSQNDRDYQHELVGRNIKALYDNVLVYWKSPVL